MTGVLRGQWNFSCKYQRKMLAMSKIESDAKPHGPSSLYGTSGKRRSAVRCRRSRVGVVAALLLTAYAPNIYGQSPPPADLKGAVLVGYQGWFRCPGDGSPGNEWSHWSKGAPTAESMSVDLYPDTSELDAKSLCQLPAATINGK